MIVPINISLSSTSNNDNTFPPPLAQFGSEGLVLIELQGKLDVAGDNEGQTIGTLRIDEATKKPTLLIGHHLLEGKLVNLPKPLASSNKVVADALDTIPDGDVSPRLAQPTSWDVIAVVKRKMVFSRRPMPMVGKVSMGAPESKGGTKSK
ncbi:uncharacterized protein B0H18DRAFT_1042547 [Fomitopsis serialis]|uniref:uncharacterized protein n=1 Tax=Fomitopsis serialis TaxID=139415 RepID=UPI002007CEC2|nr:uncharacterized protein B0H18DRAFT_1042547 [Neoantrodia serialis]KAH9915105.1 hypothetical protein B0H18DRAFT_1042547 [Neoantrodia serialis]